MRGGAMFLGLRTVIYQAPELEKAKAWYTAAFGVAPYFVDSFYVGFNIAGYELGLNPDVSAAGPGNGAVAYWGVNDIEAAYRHMIDRGAAAREPVTDVGGDIKVASVTDPFGNAIGLI